MLDLLSISRVADYLSKESVAPSTGPEITGENPVNVDQYPHGFEAHTRRAGSQRPPRAKKTEGPRSYAPRFNG